MRTIFVATIVGALCFVNCDLTIAATAKATEKGAVREFRVANYGAKGDGAADDSAAIRAAIAAAIKAGQGAAVRFDAKTYRVSAESKDGKGACFNIRKASGLTIQGAGGKTELISTSPAAGVFYFHECTNACLRGVAIDYDPLPFTQGQIIAVDVKQGTFDLKIDDGYPLLEAPWFDGTTQWGVVLNRQTRQFKPGTPSVGGFNSLTPLGDRKWRLKLDHLPSARTMAPGDAFAMRRAMGGLSAVIFVACRGGMIEDVTEYAAASCCNTFVQCEGDIVTRRVTVMIRPGTTRLLSGNADGVHCQMVRKGLLMENCRFEGMTDDGMNTYDRVRMVTEVISPTELRVHETFNMRPGDRIQVMDPRSGLVRGEATVVSVADKQRIKFDKPIAGVRTTSGVLSGIVSMTNHRDADVVYNLSTCGAGYIVRHNYFGNFRGRGLILRGVNGLIEDNVFEHTSGPGIVISNEPRWPEGPVPHDVVIRGNRFNGVGTDGGSCFSGAIVISAEGLNGYSPHSDVKNVRIENNVITDPPAIGMVLYSCDGVRMVGNRIEADGSRVFPRSKGIRLADSTGVKVEGLFLRYGRPKTFCGIEIQPSVAAGDAGFTMSGVDAQLGPGVPIVLDQRAR